MPKLELEFLFLKYDDTFDVSKENNHCRVMQQ